jgi:hypothetical protein
VPAGEHRREHLIDNRLLSDDYCPHAGTNLIESGCMLPCLAIER